MVVDGKVIEEGNCFSTNEVINRILKIIRNVDFDVTNVSSKIGNGPVTRKSLKNWMELYPPQVVLEVMSEVGTNKPLKENECSRGVRHIASANRIAGSRKNHFKEKNNLQHVIESNKTMLVDGPASVRLVCGKAEVFGCQMKESHRVLVLEGKRLPFFIAEKSTFDISLGANSGVAETVGSTNPPSWDKPVEAILSLQKRPLVVVILGGVDCGKSSLCTYLLNKLTDGKGKVAILDGDLGQSDIGSSATVGYGITSRCIPELYNLKLMNAFFVGVTSPIAAISKTIEGLTAMEAEILQRQVDFVLVNTDGFVSGEVAVKYKTDLVKALNPDVIIGVQMQDELTPLIASLQTPVFTVEPSFALKQRPPEKRQILREMTYARYLKKAKLQCYPKSQVIIEPRGAIPKKQEPEKGILVGLYGLGNKFLGIGVLREVNQLRKTLKIQTGVSAKPSRIFIGKVVVNEKLQEVQD